MITRQTVTLLSPAILAICIIAPARGEMLPKVEIAKRGKAATAYVEVPNRGSGTAFCIHPSGLFITNEHVVRGQGTVTLVLNPALKNQSVLSAKVVRVDKALDLALLRVEGVVDLPSLPLGSMENVAELLDVVAFGFPLGKALATDHKEYPAISVNSGRVTALRLKKGETEFIQIDVALNFGNSGGPVLDDEGKVIGVVVSGIRLAQGINQAIPVSNLDRFLKTPDLQFTPPSITRATADKEAQFKARVVSFVPKSPEPTLILVLKTGEDDAREFRMKKAGDEFVVSAVPINKPAGSRIEISVRLSAGTISGHTNDLVFKVGDKPVKLSTIQRIEFKPTPKVILADGKTMLEGPIIGIGALELSLGDEKVKIDASKAVRLTVEPLTETLTVLVSVVATVDGKELARVDVPMTVSDFAKNTAADPSTVPIAPPPLADEKVVKRLPETFTDVIAGGGGRYLIFRMPKLKKLAIFDINEARITKYIPLAEDNAVFGAGLDKVVIGLPGKGALERWSLATGELETTVLSNFKEDIKSVQLGHGSNGPVVINGYFMDLGTFKPLPITNDKNQDQIWSAGATYIPSGDGAVFGAWNTHYSPDSATTFVLEGNVVKRYEASGLHHVCPGPDGNTVFTAKGIASVTLNRANADDASYGYCLPAMRGPFFLSLTSSQGGKGGGFTIYMLGQRRPVAKLDAADHGLSFDGWDRELFGAWRRVFFVPDANVIAVLPGSNDQVVLHKIDVEAALEKSGIDYMLVTSKPSGPIKPDETFNYPIAVKAKSKAIAYRLDLGPKGMEVSKTGVVQWKVPANTAPGNEEVIVTISNSAGQEVFHSFKIHVVK